MNNHSSWTLQRQGEDHLPPPIHTNPLNIVRHIPNRKIMVLTANHRAGTFASRVFLTGQGVTNPPFKHINCPVPPLNRAGYWFVFSLFCGIDDRVFRTGFCTSSTVKTENRVNPVWLPLARCTDGHLCEISVIPVARNRNSRSDRITMVFFPIEVTLRK